MAELGTEQNGAETARLSCSAVERMVCEIWSDHFGHAVSPYDDFFDLGGDSIALIDFVLVAQQHGLRMRSSDAFRNSSPARLAERLTMRAAVSPPVSLLIGAREANQTRAFDWTEVEARPVPIAAGGTGEPLHVVHSDSHVQAERDAVSSWGGERPVRGFPLAGAREPLPPSWDVGEIASRYLEALREEQPAGPYRLAGFGHGAVLAFELARRLRERGEKVALLALVGPPAMNIAAGPPADADADPDELLRQRLVMLAGRFGLAGNESLDEIHARVRQDGWYDDSVCPRDLPRLQLVWAGLASAARRYEITDYDGPVILFQDAAKSDATEWTLRHAIGDLQVHLFDYGIESPIGVIRDARLTQIMRKALKA